MAHNTSIHAGDKHATQHKVAHSITTIANIPLVFWMIYTIFTLRNASYAEFEAYMSSPFNIVAAILFVLVTFKHFALEIQVVFEDYISNLFMRHFAIKALKISYLVLGLITTISILKLGL